MSDSEQLLREGIQAIIDARGAGDFFPLLPKMKALLADTPAQEPGIEGLLHSQAGLLADAWDEGYEDGMDDQLVTNPYRSKVS